MGCEEVGGYGMGSINVLIWRKSELGTSELYVEHSVRAWKLLDLGYSPAET